MTFCSRIMMCFNFGNLYCAAHLAILIGFGELRTVVDIRCRIDKMTTLALKIRVLLWI